MKCKYCGAPLEDKERICPHCGQEVEPAPEPERPVVEVEELLNDEVPVSEPVYDAVEAVPETADGEEPEAADEEAEESEEADAAEDEEEVPLPPKKSNAGLVIALVACIAAIIVLVVMLIDGKKQMEGPSGSEITGEATFKPSVSYVKDDEKDFNKRLLDRVIASCGDSTLTNRYLPYYYWGEFYGYYNNNSSSLQGMLDPLTRLDQQSYDGVKSWDEFIMDYAMNAYHTWAAAANEARKAGHSLTEEEVAFLDGRYAEMEEYALANGLDGVEGYISMNFGPYCTFEDYMTYLEEYFIGASYVEHLLNNTEFTDDEIKSFYEENKDYFNYYGVTDDDTPMMDVRHILIKPEAVTLKEGEEGYEDAVKAANEAAKAKAEEIYDLWLKGDADEASFAALAQEHTQDSNGADGGLYTQVSPGMMVEEFNDWCFDEARQVGDHGIVETQFGYHIMFYSRQWDESLYRYAVTSELENERYIEILEELRGKYELETNLKKAAVYPVNTTLN